MFPDLLLLRLLFAFGCGWLVVAAVTSFADVYGASRAGLVGGLPTTGVVSLFFIGVAQSQSAAVQATTLVPLGSAITFAFLLVYTAPKNMPFGRRMAIALCVWFLASLLLAFSGIEEFAISLVGGVAASSVIYYVHRRLGIGDTPHIPNKLGVGTVIWRGALGGFVVSGVVILSMISGPLVVGVFATAPAVWASSLYVTNRAHGVQFSRSLTKSMMRTSVLTIIPYTVLARYLFTFAGVWWGTLFAYLAISPAAWLAWRLAGGGQGGLP